jgi:hypothetical protein
MNIERIININNINTLTKNLIAIAFPKNIGKSLIVLLAYITKTFSLPNPAKIGGNEEIVKIKVKIPKFSGPDRFAMKIKITARTNELIRFSPNTPIIGNFLKCFFKNIIIN